MSVLQKLMIVAGPLLLVLLTAIAGSVVFTTPLSLLFAFVGQSLTAVVRSSYSYSQIRFLSLPISQALGLFTVVLPFVSFVSTQGAHSLVRSNKKENYRLTFPLLAIIGFQLIYETIIVTLALTHTLPASSLTCGLNERWQKLFAEKNGDAIRAIQDSFNCCGLNSVVDRAFPFSGQQSPCAQVFGRDRSCFGEWRKAEQINAGLILLVALVVFAIKALSMIPLFTSSSWTDSRWVHPFGRLATGDVEDGEGDNRANMRRLIEEASGQEEYHDEPEETVSGAPQAGNGQDHGPRVEPSLLVNTGNEWRNEGESHGI